MNERYHEHMKRLATENEIKGLKIYGQPALEYSKEELIAFICWQSKQREEDIERHHEQIQRLLFGK